MLTRISSLTFVLAFVLLASQARTGEAQVVPIKGFGTSAAYDPNTGNYSGEGVASHLGKMSFDGNIVADGVFFPAPGAFFEGTFEGSQDFVAANGDTLYADVSGDVLLEIDPETGLVYGTWYVNWEIIGGTGRFEEATGSFEGVAINPPFNPTETPWSFDWYFTGKLNLAKGRGQG